MLGWVILHWERYFYYYFSSSIQHVVNCLLVLAFYSREAGSGSRHAWQASTSSVGALSYVVVQTFKRMIPPNRLRSTNRSKANIRAETYLHIPSAHFLCRLQEEARFADPQTILVDNKDWAAFQKFSKCLQALGLAIKDLKRREGVRCA